MPLETEVARLIRAKRKAGEVLHMDEGEVKEAVREMWENWHERPASEREPEKDVLAMFRRMPAGATILEWGVGAGRHAIPLARQGLHVVGIDKEVEAIRRARIEGAEKVEGLHLAVGDALKPPLKKGEQFDGVLSVQMLHVMRQEERPRFLQELKRRVKPGGQLVLEIDADHQWIQLPHDWMPTQKGRAGIIELLRHPQTKLLDLERRTSIHAGKMEKRLEKLFPIDEWTLIIKTSPAYEVNRGGASVTMRMLVKAIRREKG